MKRIGLVIVAGVISFSGWGGGLCAAPPTKGGHWIERFASALPRWKKGWFYRFTNAESYYYLNGNRQDIRPAGQRGLWLALRGVAPTKTPRPMRLMIKPGLGGEASFIAFGLNSHYANLTVRFIDLRGRVFAISCVPKTGYYVYTRLAVPLKKGLRAIEFDAGAGQVPGWINITDVEVFFGPVPKGRATILHERNAGRCFDAGKPYR